MFHLIFRLSSEDSFAGFSLSLPQPPLKRTSPQESLQQSSNMPTELKTLQMQISKCFNINQNHRACDA